MTKVLIIVITFFMNIFLDLSCIKLLLKLILLVFAWIDMAIPHISSKYIDLGMESGFATCLDCTYSNFRVKNAY